MSNSAEQHRESAPPSVRCAVLTVSDTRTLETDKGGALVAELLTAAGHTVAERQITPDEPARIEQHLHTWVANGAIDAVLLTGGTGIAPRDQTYETITTLLTKPLPGGVSKTLPGSVSKPIPGYGELFRMLSYQEIGPAAMLSRAVGGVVGGTVVLTMPGSTNAVRLAMEKLILPELGHLVAEANKT